MRIDLIDCFVPEGNRYWDEFGQLHEDEANPIREERWYSLAICDYEKDCKYTVKIGDEQLNLKVCIFHNALEFERGVYFESAAGPTELIITAQRKNETQTREILRATLYVVPSKIGESNYQQMIRDLQSVCRALVTDIRGKSSRGNRKNLGLQYQPWRTFNEELQSVCSLCLHLQPLLAEIRNSPQSMMVIKRRHVEPAHCRSPRMIAGLMKRGINPIKTDLSEKCLVNCISESVDIAEHRLIKAFLLLLRSRLNSCRANVDAEIKCLEASKRYRDQTRNGERTLWESVDVPRIKRLQEFDSDAENALNWMEFELSLPFWGKVHEEMVAPSAIQFNGNDYYLMVANMILRYLRDTSHWGGTFNSKSMMKNNWRMYEQWVLIQLVAAFEHCGLHMPEWDEIMSRSFDSTTNFEIARNTSFRAAFAENWDISIRYEPLIVTKKDSWRHPEETLCHFDSFNSSWQPDIVIELCRINGRLRQSVYAVVLDAKYSRNPTNEMRDNVAKYARIRTVEGQHGRRVARQVWLVYPGKIKNKHFFLDDEALCFSEKTGITYIDSHVAIESAEQVMGEMIALPGEHNGYIDEVSEIGVKPLRMFVEFARGTLKYFKERIINEETTRFGSPR